MRGVPAIRKQIVSTDGNQTVKVGPQRPGYDPWVYTHAVGADDRRFAEQIGELLSGADSPMQPSVAPKLNSTACNWLRGLDLNQRPLGYEPFRSKLNPVDSVTHPVRNRLFFTVFWGFLRPKLRPSYKSRDIHEAMAISALRSFQSSAFSGFRRLHAARRCRLATRLSLDRDPRSAAHTTSSRPLSCAPRFPRIDS